MAGDLERRELHSQALNAELCADQSLQRQSASCDHVHAVMHPAAVRRGPETTLPLPSRLRTLG